MFVLFKLKLSAAYCIHSCLTETSPELFADGDFVHRMSWATEGRRTLKQVGEVCRQKQKKSIRYGTVSMEACLCQKNNPVLIAFKKVSQNNFPLYYYILL